VIKSTFSSNPANSVALIAAAAAVLLQAFGVASNMMLPRVGPTLTPWHATQCLKPESEGLCWQRRVLHMAKMCPSGVLRTRARFALSRSGNMTTSSKHCLQGLYSEYYDVDGSTNRVVVMHSSRLCGRLCPVTTGYGGSVNSKGYGQLATCGQPLGSPGCLIPATSHGAQAKEVAETVAFQATLFH